MTTFLFVIKHDYAQLPGSPIYVPGSDKGKKKFFAKSTNMVAMLSYARGHFGFPLLFTQIIKGHVLTRNNETKPAPKQNNQNDWNHRAAGMAETNEMI